MERQKRSIVLCGVAQQSVWDNYVKACPSATLSHQFAWQSIIKRAYGHDSLYLMACEGDSPVGILPLVLVKRPLLGASLTSMPFLDYGGVCANDLDTAQALVERAVALMTVHNSRSLELRQPDATVQIGFSRQDKVSMILDLSRGSEAIWKALPAKVRNQVRKAEKSGLTVSVGGRNLLDEFYDIFVVNMRDLGSPVHGKEFFVEMFSGLGESVRMTIVRDGQRAVGGLVALFFKDTMLVPWASSLREYFSKCPNNLLYWEAIQEGCKRRCARFDFGRSTIDSGTYDFKKQWGAQPKQLHWQLLSADGAVASTVSSDSAPYRFVSEVWKRLPAPVARLIGPSIRKYLTN